MKAALQVACACLLAGLALPACEVVGPIGGGVCCSPGTPSCHCTRVGGWAPSEDQCPRLCDAHPDSWGTQDRDSHGCPVFRPRGRVPGCGPSGTDAAGASMDAAVDASDAELDADAADGSAVGSGMDAMVHDGSPDVGTAEDAEDQAP